MPTGPARPVVVVMGVTGTGKSTVGRLLARALDVPYAEADDFHSAENIAKMTAGGALDDVDRGPWLDAIGAWAHDRGEHGGVVSCSALKRAYRDRLRLAQPALFFLHLSGERELIERRLSERRGHFMPPSLLGSQFADLEPLKEDEPGVTLDIGEDPALITRRCLAVLPHRWH